MSAEVDDYLAHFGVKGMKWGVRKERTPVSNTERLKQLDKKISRLPGTGHDILAGYGLRGYYAKRELKRMGRKDPNFSEKDMTSEQKTALRKKVKRSAYTELSLLGVGEAAVAAAVGKFGGKALGLSDSRSTAAGASLAALVLVARGRDVLAVNTTYRKDKIHAEQSEIHKAMTRERNQKKSKR